MRSTKINGAIAGEEEVRHAALLAAALHAICLANQSQLAGHRLIVSRPPSFDADLDFEGRVPLGFAFSDGHEALFHVPTGHRFVIEHVHVSPGSPEGEIEVQMIGHKGATLKKIGTEASKAHGWCRLGDTCRYGATLSRPNLT